MTLFGVDVSHWQGRIDWQEVQNDGIEFAICRASLGRIVDKEFAGKFSKARKAGLVVGAYHYLWPGVDPEKAVKLFCDTIGPLDGVLTALDVEKQPKGVSDAEVYAAVKAWVRAFRERAGDHPLLLYTGRWFWKGRIKSPPGEWIGPLWHSEYVGVEDKKTAFPYRKLAAKVPGGFWRQTYGGWEGADILQFTSNGKVAGFRGRLDVNAFKGTREELEAFGRPKAARAQETAPMSIYMRTDRTGTFTIAPGKVVNARRPNATGTAWDVAKIRPASNLPSGVVRFDFRLGRTVGNMFPTSLLHVPEGFFEGLFVDTAEVDEVFDDTPANTPPLGEAELKAAKDAGFDDGVERGEEAERERVLQILDGQEPDERKRLKKLLELDIDTDTDTV